MYVFTNNELILVVGSPLENKKLPQIFIFNENL